MLYYLGVMKKKIAFVIGTRPEGIKLAPIIHCLKHDYADDLKSLVIATGQHDDLLADVFSFFNIVPDYSLTIVRKNNLLSELLAELIQPLELLFQKEKPDCVIVQGDTLSTLAGAMASFYQQIPIGYVESGLRSEDLYAPFPEEANRLMVTKLARWHFTPTDKASVALKKEGIMDYVYQVGNTVVDAIDYAKAVGFSNDYSQHEWINHRNNNRKMILVTIHRRENWDININNIIKAIHILSEKYYDDLDIVWIAHANPSLSKHIKDKLDSLSNVYIYPPVNYSQLLHLMTYSYFIITDSGGIQEEAPSMDIPVLVARDVSERMEGVELGCSQLVGTNTDTIVDSAITLLTDSLVYNKMRGVPNPYGDGKSSKRILDVLCS